jgi:hypothetical protein
VKVVLCGDFRQGRLAASWERGLHANGISVVRFDIVEEKAALHAVLCNRFTHRLTIHSYALRRRAARNYNRRLVDRAAAVGADAVFIHNGEFIFPETARTLKSRGVRVVVFHADNPLPPHYNNRPETLPLARDADLYLVWSEALASKLRTKQAIGGARFLPFAWDPEVFPYAPVSGEAWNGVVFIGGWDRDRERLLDIVARHFPLRVYGPGYWGSRTGRRSRSRAAWAGRELEGPDAASVIRQSAICLNVLRSQHVIDGEPDGLIMRHFEVPGSGGFLLSTRSGGATDLFPEGECAEYFSDPEECCRKIEACLSVPHARRRMAAQAHERVAHAHTYAARMDELIQMLQDSGPAVNDGTRLVRAAAR